MNQSTLHQNNSDNSRRSSCGTCCAWNALDFGAHIARRRIRIPCRAPADPHRNELLSSKRDSTAVAHVQHRHAMHEASMLPTKCTLVVVLHKPAAVRGHRLSFRFIMGWHARWLLCAIFVRAPTEALKPGFPSLRFLVSRTVA